MKTITKLTCPAFAALALACFAVLSTPNAFGVNPPPDGGYPGANTAEGEQALLNLTTGLWNTALGFQALNQDTAGNSNTATGGRALFSNTAGDRNTATGAQALLSNTIGNDNTAEGLQALYSNTSGSNNTAFGRGALYSNIGASGNTANGAFALYKNRANYNTAYGYSALFNNTTGYGNVAVGFFALPNKTGSRNVGVGYYALSGNSGGNENTAIGDSALFYNITGSYNTAIGDHALFQNGFGNTSGSNNTAIGNRALAGSETGDNNTGVGVGAGNNVTHANNVTCIGANVLGADVSNTTWIGNIYGVHTQNATTAPVIVSVDGQLGTVASSERFKKDIATMEKASEVILSLRPVTFHYKADAENTPQFGLIAEEVAKVNPALVLPDKEGKPYTVRYEAVNAMLLNEFLKEHRRVQELEMTAAHQAKDMQDLREALKNQAGKIEKISAQLERSRPIPKVVVNK